MTYQKHVVSSKLVANDSVLLLLTINQIPMMYMPAHPFPGCAAFNRASNSK